MTALFAVPGLSDAFIAAIDLVGTSTGLAPPLEPFSALSMFMVNLAGVLGVCWNVMILRSGAYEMIRINVVARWAVAALIIYYVAARGVTPVILLFAVSEIFGSLVEIRQKPLARPAATA
ncbi:hypothetical protein [Polycyclovorans algicola]|uniref:hypothetical protein n=1 Tax=Polycyclovorans algicola TaxID=616992 RepID=UPI0004A76113|nr:hypothetical protein [Polycyclovorans algicola]